MTKYLTLACLLVLVFASLDVQADDRCPGDQFYVDRNGGECWSCGDHGRDTSKSYSSNQACKRLNFKSASRKHDLKFGEAAWDCGTKYKNTFHDPWTKYSDLGSCWSCDGWSRNSTHIKGGDACVRTTTQKAIRKGKAKSCGAENVRACYLWERIPSCDKGLMESPKQGGLCVKPPAGVDPFLGTIAETAAIVTEFAAGSAASCEKAVLKAGTEIDLGIPASSWSRQCTANVAAGFICETTGVFDIILALSDLGSSSDNLIQSIEKDLNKWRASKPCQDASKGAANPVAAEYSCAIGMMLVGDTVQDNICLVEASKAGLFELGGPKASSVSCQNTGRMMYTIADTIFVTAVIMPKLAGPLKKKFRDALVKRKTLKAKDKRKFIDLYTYVEDKAKAEKSVDRIMKVAKALGAVKTVAGTYDKITKIPACTNDWSAADFEKAGIVDVQANSRPFSQDSMAIFANNSGDKWLMFELGPDFSYRKADIEIDHRFRHNFGHQIYAGGPGQWYGLASSGKLYYYEYDLEKLRYVHEGKVIGTGWQGFKQVLAAGNRELYAIRDNGELLYYRYDDRFKWEVSGKVIGTGWNFENVFAGGDGYLYALRPNGQLLGYHHDKNFRWVTEGVHFGDGWDLADRIMPIGGGRILMTRKDSDNLLFYSHDRRFKWKETGKFVASGWKKSFGKEIYPSIYSLPLP